VSVIVQFIDIVLHVDKYLTPILQQYGGLTYLFMFLLIFCETGLVITPILPGDSVLFALGALAAAGGLDIAALGLVLYAAAVIGDSVNYAVGAKLGPAVFKRDDSRFLKREYLEKTHAFYEKYGGMAVILGRFMPIIRTFVPFVAGIGKLKYSRFLAYNLIGGALWIALFLACGYFFGGLPFVQENFSLVALGIIIVSFIPPVVTAVKVRLSVKRG
jgi:membrane-associated protein